MKARNESILFLVVGLIAGFSGAYGLLYDDYQDDSVWLILWNIIRAVAGLLGIILGLKGILNDSEK